MLPRRTFLKGLLAAGAAVGLTPVVSAGQILPAPVVPPVAVVPPVDVIQAGWMSYSTNRPGRSLNTFGSSLRGHVLTGCHVLASGQGPIRVRASSGDVSLLDVTVYPSPQAHVGYLMKDLAIRIPPESPVMFEVLAVDGRVSRVHTSLTYYEA